MSKRKFYPEVCGFDKRNDTDVEINCVICEQPTWKSDSTIMAVLDEETDKVEKMEWLEEKGGQDIPLKQICNDCAVDIWAAVNMMRKALATRFNKT